MTAITVICREVGYDDILVYAINVRDPQSMNEVKAIIKSERTRDLGECREITPLVAFDGDLLLRADWRWEEPEDVDCTVPQKQEDEHDGA